MPPRSLFALAEAVAIKHVDYLYDIGNILTWRQVSGIISKVKDPYQLRLIEEASPHLRGETAELWKDFIQRDYRLLAQSKKYRPSDPADWWKVYYKYKKEDDEQKAAALAKFKGDMDKIKKDKETHRTSMMGMRNAPRIVHSTWWGNRAAPKYFGKTQSEITLAKAIRASGQVARANRVASRFLSSSSNIGGRMLDPRKQVTRAPAAMIQDHEIAQKPPRPLVQAPRRINNANHATGGIKRTVDPEAAAREERLKRIKEGKRPVTLSAEALDRDVNDLFGDGAGGRVTPPKKTVAPTPSARPALLGRGGLAGMLGSGSSTTGKITRIPVKTASSPSKNGQQHRPNTNSLAKTTNNTSRINMPSPVAPVHNKAVPQHSAKKPSGSGTNLPNDSGTNKRKQDPRAALMPVKRRKI